MKKLNLERYLIEFSFPGVALSLISGLLFTANNFIINQLDVVVSDAVLVRCIIQIIVYTVIINSSGEKFFHENSKKQLLTVTQGLKTSYLL